jgi:Uma2 family endonuclease
MTEVLERPQTRRRPSFIRRFTRQEVYALSDMGCFADRRVNLINGRILSMPLPGPEHTFTLDGLCEYLDAMVPAGAYLRRASALGIGRYNDPGPDVAIVPGSRHDYVHRHPTQALFVAEVSRSTRRIDLKVKPALYARAGVPEYWVIDLEKRRIVVHCDPEGDGNEHHYRALCIFREGVSVAPLFAPESPVAVSALLPGRRSEAHP